MKWLHHSDISITLTLNPTRWVWRPTAYRESTKEWSDGLWLSWRARWLFLNIHIWIDDGSW